MFDPRDLVEALPVGIAVVDRDRRYVQVNAVHARVLDRPIEAFAGALIDDGMSPQAARTWGDAIDAVFALRTQRAIEIRAEASDGNRRIASVLAPIGSDLVCIASRDITEVRSTIVIDAAARAMGTGMLVVEAPSGRVVFENDEAVRLFGSRMHVASTREYNSVVAYDTRGELYAARKWPMTRALAGEHVVDELVEVHLPSGARHWLNVQASPVRDRSGAIVAAVSTYNDVTESRRVTAAAKYLADAARLLEQFDPASSLQALVELAIPALADWAFVHLLRADGPWLVAIANTDPVRAAASRAFVAGPLQLSPRTALARVLAGSPRELIDVDDATLEDAANDDDHLHQMRERGYRSAVVVPLATRDGVLGAMTFAMGASGRRYTASDVDTFAELARRTGNALDNARLFEGERQARRAAEAARDRTRRLQELTSKLSRAVEEAQVVSTIVDAGREAIGAQEGAAWLLRDASTLELVASVIGIEPVRRERAHTIPMTASLPVCDAVRSGAPIMFDSQAAMRSRYPSASLPIESPNQAWAIVPFVVAGRGIGAVSFAFAEERSFSAEDAELLAAMAGQASLALERSIFVEAERQARTEADEATSRERKLREVATRLTGALTVSAVAELAAREVVDYLGATASLTAIRDGDQIRIVGVHGPHDPGVLARVQALPIAYDVPVAEAMRKGTLIWCESRARLERRYLHVEDTWRPRGIRSWGAVPFQIDGRPGGAIAISFRRDHELTDHESDFLAGVAQLTSLALERARLYEALHAQNAQLALAVERAQVGERRKDEFLAMLGHELRNPLAPIANALQVMDLKLDTLGRERGVIRRQVAHLARLIDDLLDVSRISRGKITVERQVVELGGVIAKALELASPILAQRQQRLVVDVAREGLRIDGDPTRLAQIFQNLITNASKYSDADTTIHVHARAEAGRVVVDVRDEGIGIRREMLTRVFDMFVQGERMLDRSQGGLGLGLTIARSLCELHGGTITAASEGVGRGSTFTVTLPHVVRPETSSTAASPVTLREGSGRRILVVDDNVDAAQMLHELLAMQGHETVVAHDGGAALALALSFKPEVALLDIGLPVMDGYELARRLRAELGSNPLRLIAITGYGQDADRARARDAGFDHHLVKPIELPALISLLGM